MSDKNRGLFEKYKVERFDGKPMKSDAIVLEFADPHARAGIKAFSKSVRDDGYYHLADDLDKKLKRYEVELEMKSESGSAIQIYRNGDVVIKAVGNLTFESGGNKNFVSRYLDPAPLPP